MIVCSELRYNSLFGIMSKRSHWFEDCIPRWRMTHGQNICHSRLSIIKMAQHYIYYYRLWNWHVITGTGSQSPTQDMPFHISPGSESTCRFQGLNVSQTPAQLHPGFVYYLNYEECEHFQSLLWDLSWLNNGITLTHILVYSLRNESTWIM